MHRGKKKPKRHLLLASAIISAVACSTTLADPIICGLDADGLSPACKALLTDECQQYAVAQASCLGLGFPLNIACLVVAENDHINAVIEIIENAPCSEDWPEDPIPEPGAVSYAYAIAVNIASPNLFRDLDLWRR